MARLREIRRLRSHVSCMLRVHIAKIRYVLLVLFYLTFSF